MEIVRGPAAPNTAPQVVLEVDRHVLAKRRWRGVAADGKEFGFELSTPLAHGAAFFRTGSACYVISQRAEPVIEVAPGEAAEAARTGWMLGNLHFPIEVTMSVIRAPDDPAIRQALEREGVPFVLTTAVFQPMKAAAHGHHH